LGGGVMWSVGGGDGGGAGLLVGSSMSLECTVIL
jgi:hypothetical protein